MNALREQQLAFIGAVYDSVDEKNYANIQLRQSRLANNFSDEQRLQIYHNNIYIGLRKALSAVYPVVNKLVGDDFFRHTVQQYIRQHPSRSGNLHEFGREFPLFLSRLSSVEPLAYLPDVASLEWAYHEVFHVQESGVLNINELSALDDAQYDKLRLTISPSCRYLQSGFPVLRIWETNQEGVENDEIIDIDAGGVSLVLCRNGKNIEFHPLTPGMFALIDSLASGHVFTKACECALDVDAECDIGAALQYLVSHRIVTGFFAP